MIMTRSNMNGWFNQAWFENMEDDQFCEGAMFDVKKLPGDSILWI